HVTPTRLPLHIDAGEDAAFVFGLHIVETGTRMVSGRVPVAGTGERGTHARALARRFHTGYANGPSVGIQAARPGHFLRVLPAVEELAIGTIQHVEEAVAVGLDQQLARFTLPHGVNQSRGFLGVVVPHV